VSQESRDGSQAAAVRPVRRRRIVIAAAVLAAASIAAGVGVAVAYNGPPVVRETLAAVGTLGDPAGHEPVYGAAFSPDGSTVATADGFYGAHLWNVAAGRQTAAVSGPDEQSVDSVAFSPDGATLAAGGHSTSSDTVYLWNVRTARLTGTLTAPTGFGGVISVAFSPDGTTLAAADGGG